MNSVPVTVHRVDRKKSLNDTFERLQFVSSVGSMVYRDIYLGMGVVRTIAYFQKKVGLHGLMPEHPIFVPADLPGLYTENIKDLTDYKIIQITSGLG